MADWSLESLSFFLEVSPSSSSLMPREPSLSRSRSSPLASLSLRFPLTLDTVLFGDDTSSQSPVDGSLFTSMPRRKDRAATRHVSEFRSACSDQDALVIETNKGIGIGGETNHGSGFKLIKSYTDLKELRKRKRGKDE